MNPCETHLHGPKYLPLLRPAMCLLVLLMSLPAFAAPRELRVALLPIIDSFPYHVAQQEGLFDAADLRVEGLAVSSAVNRDQLMQSGEIDGMLNELMTTANFNRQTSRVKIVAVVRAADQDHPLFRILGAPGSSLRNPRDLSGIPIGISRNTIIEYVTDRLLQHSAIPADAVRKVSVPSIPERYQLLMQGQLTAATLPDPLAQSAMASGAVLLIDDRAIAGVSLSVLSFTNEALHQKEEAVKRFLAAWNQAAERINTHPDDYRALLMKKIRIPPNIQNDYRIPPFAYRQVPNREQWQDVMTWMVDRNLLDQPIDFSTSVDTGLLDSSTAPSAPQALDVQ
jgi:NitT/TauT family transport system substrate-binding protein